MPDHKCSCCRKTSLPLKRCAACRKAWYCSRECQRYDWVRHIFDCNPSRPITTADHLALAANRNLIPDHRPTCKDYGFYNANDDMERAMLLGLYIGLLEPQYLGVKSPTLHRWRLEGTLIENIKREFERLPEGERGAYYVWFLQNEHLLSRAQTQKWERQFQSTVEECLYRAWRFIGNNPTASAGEILQYEKTTPKRQYDCFVFYAMLLASRHPAPNVDIWISFGFCACDNLDDEMTLAQQHTDLIYRCSFDEYCVAYASSSLVPLMREKGISISDPLVIDVLSEVPNRNKTVWDLKRYIEEQAINGLDDSAYDPSSSVASDYGFTNCRTPEEHKLLFDAYKDYFALGRKANPLKLHRACIQGRLFAFLTKDMKIQIKQRKLCKRLMQNSYPLPLDSPNAALAGMTLTPEVQCSDSYSEVPMSAIVSIPE